MLHVSLNECCVSESSAAISLYLHDFMQCILFLIMYVANSHQLTLVSSSNLSQLKEHGSIMQLKYKKASRLPGGKN